MGHNKLMLASLNVSKSCMAAIALTSPLKINVPLCLE